jgi:hypothetical protein
MKSVRKFLIALLIMTYIVSTSGNILAAELISVASVEVEYDTKVTASLDNEIDTASLSSEDVKILHDISILGTDLDSADARKALVSLNEELSENAVYNLITIEWPDSSMDFKTGTNLAWEDIYNELGEWIESIYIIDPKNIEVTYFDPISDSELVVKIFRDLTIESLESISNTQIWVITSEELLVNNDYIFMLLEASNLDNSTAIIESGIYNFNTPASLEQAPVVEPDLNAASEEVTTSSMETEEEKSGEMTETQSENSQQESIASKTDVSSTTAEADSNKQVQAEEWITKASGSTTDNESVEESNIAAIAAEATAVPETGTTTSVMIFLTMLLALGIHMKRRK